MNSQEIRALQEAYNQVYAPQELDEASPSNPNLYTGRHGQTPTEYMAGRSDGGKRISGNERNGPASYVSRLFRDAPTPPGAKPQNVKKLSPSERNELNYRKANFKLKSGGGSANTALDVTDDPNSRPIAARSRDYKVGGGERYGIAGIGLADSYDLYDIVLSHLLDEGYADTQEQAEVIMVNMSEDWRDSIAELDVKRTRNS